MALLRPGPAFLVASLLLASLGVAHAQAEKAQDGAPAEDLDASRRAAGIIRTTNSPFCPGQTLDSCPSSRAAEWRNDIRQWTAEGLETVEIRSRLQTRVPGFELSNRPLGTAPLFFGVGVLSLIALALVARRLVRKPGTPKGTHSAPRAKPSGPRDALDDALDDELRRLEG